MSPEDAKKELLRLRRQLTGTDAELGRALAVPLEEEVGEESSDQHPGDVGTATFSRELDLSLQENTERLLSHVDRALEKIEEGTYGICDHCGRPIEEARLGALPYATLCLKDQQELEHLSAL